MGCWHTQGRKVLERKKVMLAPMFHKENSRLVTWWGWEVEKIINILRITEIKHSITKKMVINTEKKIFIRLDT